MEPQGRVVRLYADAKGKAWFGEWLTDLRDRRARARIHARLQRLQAGNFGDHRNLPGGIKELRLAFGPGYRVYVAEDGPMIVVLLLGGDKSTQEQDIDRARWAWNDYQTRCL